jgi:NAD(P)-dependent dehydrogenase (short-subunit alcohol dehydrogenase family)
VRDPAVLERLDSLAPAPDVLVNNAVPAQPFSRLENVSDDLLDEVLSVGILAVLRWVKHVVPGMKARGYGRIVNIGSVAGRAPGRGQVAYATAKSALLGLTRGVAAEVGRAGVTVNLLEVGLIDTERIQSRLDPDVLQALVSGTAAGRMGRIEEVAAVVEFLTSEAASYVTGAVLEVSGGAGLGRIDAAR